MTTQLSLGLAGVKAVAYCDRCRRQLTNPVSVGAHMGPICRGHSRSEAEMIKGEFSDVFDDQVPLSEALVLENDEGRMMTNVPHLVVWHSPDGFNWGYGGSGPADLALNVIEAYLQRTGYKGLRSDCFRGDCFALTVSLHQAFKWEVIAGIPPEGARIEWAAIDSWMKEHMTPELLESCAEFTIDDLDNAAAGSEPMDPNGPDDLMKTVYDEDTRRLMDRMDDENLPGSW